jgi:hypothetical protein
MDPCRDFLRNYTLRRYSAACSVEIQQTCLSGAWRYHYPTHLQPPPPNTDTLWAASQVNKDDPAQRYGLGRKMTVKTSNVLE